MRSNSGSGGINQPTIYFETDDNGNQFLRVEESRLTDKNFQTTISDETVNNSRYGFWVAREDTRSASLNDIDVSNAQNGIALIGTDTVSIYDYDFEGTSNRSSQYASAIRVGNRSDGDTRDVTYVQRVTADGEDRALRSYARDDNTDFLDLEAGNAPVYLRDLTASNFSDAIIDAKSDVYIQNATFDEAYRVLRAHQGVDIYIANSELTSENGQALAWLAGSSSRIFYYNTTWNGKSQPDASEIRGHRLTEEQTRARVIELDHNPLPDIDPFFETNVETIHIELFRNGRWVALNLDGGSAGVENIGDPRFDISDVVGRNAEIRVRYENDGGFSEYSDTLIIQNGRFAGYRETDSRASSAQQVANNDDRDNGRDNDNGNDRNNRNDDRDNDQNNDQGGGNQQARPQSSAQTRNDDPGQQNYSEVQREFERDFREDWNRSNANADNYNGNGGNNRFHGDRGDDRLNGNGGNDRLFGGRDDDIVIGGNGNDILHGNAGRDLLNGGNGNDRLEGGDSRDILIGAGGRDTLNGGNGNDVLIGGAGRDVLNGGRGEDTFVFARNSLNDGSVDRIVGFSINEGDVLDLSAVVNSARINANSVDDYIDLRQRGNTTELRVDADGNANGNRFVTIAELQGFRTNRSEEDLFEDGVLDLL
ncbi:MAG: calcium-binding protein [Pseudomonadota bacterium]